MLAADGCVACGAGQYKADTGSAACDACPTHSWSLPGSDAAADCKCDAGYAGADGGECAACVEGKYGVGPERGLRGGGRRGWCEEWARRG